MRGKLTGNAAQALQYRNIPAYAGKTIIRHTHAAYKKEHPRVCGENPVKLLSGDTRGGTSPRMRGKPAYTEQIVPIIRNIPAYAGKTWGNSLNRE